MKQVKNSLQLPKPTTNSWKIENKLMAVASGERNLRSKHDHICHVAKVKAATFAHSMVDVIHFRGFMFVSNPTLRENHQKIYFIQNKENNIREIFRTLRLQLGELTSHVA